MKLISTYNCSLTNKAIYGCTVSSSTGFKNDMFCFYRNYHVFYYLLLGASEEERKEFKLLPPEKYSYLKQVQDCTSSSLYIWYEQPIVCDLSF